MCRVSPSLQTVITVFLVLFLLSGIFICVSADTPAEIAISWIQKGDHYAAQGMYREALEAYDSAIATDPYNSIAWNRKGIALMNSGNDTDAVTAFEKSLELDPYSNEAWNNKGDAYSHLGQYSDAIAAYDRALAINQNDLYALVKKGINLQESGKPDDAMKIYQEVIQIAEREVRKHPNDARYDADLWTNKGDALTHLGRYFDALDAYQTALEINPKHEGALKGKKEVEDLLMQVRGTFPENSIIPPTIIGANNTTQSVPLSPVLPVCGVIVAVLMYYGIRKR
jgi:tetratricopeptide (TPR) repeat protein